MRQDRGASAEASDDAGPELFDVQAASFDKRTGLPEDCCRAVARKLVEFARETEGGLVVEVGCGTGQIGRWVEAPAVYVGFDYSLNMLREFRRRLGATVNPPPLIHADANAAWPFADGAASVVFSSRAAHLLEQEHFASEVLRLASPRGATLVTGRVERTRGSVKERMAHEMNERLRQRGLKGRRGERRNRRLFEACERRGAVVLEPFNVATWNSKASPRQSLESWRRLKGLGGIEVSEEVRSEILAELETWAAAEFGSLDEEFEFEETYVLSPLRVRSGRAV